MITGHGDDIYEYEGNIQHNFSSNVYLESAMPGLKDFLKECLSSLDHYPPAEPLALERLLSLNLHNNQWENLITNGATEAIYLIAQATGAGCRSAVLAPTFSEYADACRIHGHQVEYIHSLNEVNEEMNVVWLCNPNNPTGTVIPREELVRVAFNNPSTVFVIDQSYEFFCLEEQLRPRESSQLGNVILLHSMTKKYAVPGLRLGYVTGPQSLIQTLREHRMPWSVNALALDACWYILEHQAEYTFDVASYLSEAQRLNDRLGKLEGVEVMPTQTNFMLMRIPRYDAVALKRRLVDEAGILVRAAHNFHGLDRHYIRVAAQSPESNDWLVESLSKIL